MFIPYSDPYHDARLRPGTSIIQVTRTAVPFTSASDADRYFKALSQALDSVERSRHDLLIDIRLAVGRNDPEFEAAIAPHRARMQRGFRRIAMLVNSIAGELQVKRLARQDGVVVRSFQDEGAALEWLGQAG